jgi:hypothetical protein
VADGDGDGGDVIVWWWWWWWSRCVARTTLEAVTYGSLALGLLGLALLLVLLFEQLNGFDQRHALCSVRRQTRVPFTVVIKKGARQRAE